MKTYAIANNKPSEQAAKARMLKNKLLPAFGAIRIDEIKTVPGTDLPRAPRSDSSDSMSGQICGARTGSFARQAPNPWLDPACFRPVPIGTTKKLQKLACTLSTVGR